MTRPPPLPTRRPLATKDQRIRAGLIDHFIDSSVWFWLFVLFGWNIFHLDAPVDARSFFILLSQTFPISITIIILFVFLDILLCFRRGQSIGQFVNGIYKKNKLINSNQILNRFIGISNIWIHGLISRCLGLPLLTVSILIWLTLDPTVTPIHLYDFSLIEPEGSLLLLIFLLKIIGGTFLLYGLFLPFGLGFIREQLPTWYDQLLDVHIVEKQQKSHS